MYSVFAPTRPNHWELHQVQLGLARIRDALLHMRQNPRDHFRLLDAGDHLELAAATGALEPLSPSHRDVARGDGLIGVGGIRFAAHTPMRWRHRRTQLGLCGANTRWSGSAIQCGITTVSKNDAPPRLARPRSILHFVL
jgi:hypothetical protein